MDSIAIPAADGSGSFAAHVARPRSTPAGAVVVIQEIFGVNDAMRAAAGEIAGLGFNAVVPDLFWRLQPGIDLTDKSDAEWQQAMGYFKAFDQDKGVDDLRATLAAARALPGCNGRAGTIGYCLGGTLLAAAAESGESGRAGAEAGGGAPVRRRSLASAIRPGTRPARSGPQAAST